VKVAVTPAPGTVTDATDAFTGWTGVVRRPRRCTLPAAPRHRQRAGPALSAVSVIVALPFVDVAPTARGHAGAAGGAERSRITRLAGRERTCSSGGKRDDDGVALTGAAGVTVTDTGAEKLYAFNRYNRACPGNSPVIDTEWFSSPVLAAPKDAFAVAVVPEPQPAAVYGGASISPSPAKKRKLYNC